MSLIEYSGPAYYYARQPRVTVASMLGSGRGGGTYRYERPHVHGRDRGLEGVERVHHGLYADRLAIAGRAVVDDAPLPGDLELGVAVAPLEEGHVVGDDGLLHALVQDDVVPAGVLDAPVQLPALLPVALVEDPYLAVQLLGPRPGRQQQGVGLGRVRGEHVEVGDERVGPAAVAAVGQVDDEVDVVPAVQEAAVDEMVGQDADAAVEAARGRHVHLPGQRAGELLARLVVDGLVRGVAGAGVGQQRRRCLGRHHQLQLRVLGP